jgi:hypothetical protein
VTPDHSITIALRTALSNIHRQGPQGTADYRIAVSLGPGFLGISRTGAIALLLPLDTVPHAATARQGGGFSLAPATRVAFDYDGRRWEQPAATLECTAPEMVDPFLVLAFDIAQRLSSTSPMTWQAVLDYVDEWQALLTGRGLMTIERQLGLWAELWVISLAADPDRLVAAWRGPESAATDFFLDGIGLEVKASRQSLVHHVSQRQLESPLGEHEAFLMSVWLGIDPGSGQSLPNLVDDALARVSDASALLRHVALTGYSPVDREQYSTRFIALETPRCFEAVQVPRVRTADRGVSDLRYVVTLEPERALATTATTRLWYHFCRIDGPITANKIGSR